MRGVIKGGLTVLAALLVFAALRQVSAPILIGANVFAVAVIVYAAYEGEIAGALVGAVSGLIVDAFSLGLFGLAGLVKTVTGFTAGYVSRKVSVLTPGRMFVFAGALGAFDLGFWILLEVFIAGEKFPWSQGWLLVQPLGTATLAAGCVHAIRRIRTRRER
jgi:rod shape-determining protein MreD